MSGLDIRTLGLGATLALLVPATTAVADVDLSFDPALQQAQVNDVVDVDILAATADGGTQQISAIDTVVVWDTAVLALVGAVQDNSDFTWLSTGFLPDPDGINDDLTDGEVKFTALSNPSTPATVMPPPGQVVTTLQFEVLVETEGTVVSFLAESGQFAKTQVLAFSPPNTDVTGDVSSTATVQTGPPPKCMVDDDCDDGLFCSSESCDLPSGTCVAISTCPPFVMGCLVGGDCDEDNDMCLPPVPDDDLCPMGQLCAPDGECVNCLADEDCDDGLFCSSESCDLPSGTCVAISTCPPFVMGCLVGGDCDEDNDMCLPPVPDDDLCPMGQLCAPDGECVDCLADEDCDDGLFCSSESCDLPSGTCVAISTCPPFVMGCLVGGACDEDNDECPIIQDDDLCPMGQLCAPDGECALPCATLADCGDLDDDGKRDDPCLWYDCVDGLCLSVFRGAGQADMGGFNGACPIDIACDGNDRFHALNCFANQSTTGIPGEPYPCEDSPPAAVNIDAGGPNGSCILDGVCDGNDAFAALNCFENINTSGLPPYLCTCIAPGPAEPAPEPHIVARVGLRLQAPRAVRAGDRLEVEVFLEEALDDLRGYQLHVGVSGGHSGTLALLDIHVDQDRKDHVFPAIPYWQAFNTSTKQMLVGLDGRGCGTRESGYLATFTYRVTDDAHGTFVVDLLYDDAEGAHRTFLFPTAVATKIQIERTRAAAIRVISDRRTRAN